MKPFNTLLAIAPRFGISKGLSNILVYDIPPNLRSCTR